MTFDGNPLKYPSFMENFKANVEDIETSPNASGKAKEAISGTVEQSRTRLCAAN